MNRWSVTESAHLTACFIVADGQSMPGDHLDDAELRAVLMLAQRLKVRRSVVARRIGWSRDRLIKWGSHHGLDFLEEDYPDEPLRYSSVLRPRKEGANHG